MKKRGSFTFNGDYKDLDQVVPYLDEFEEIKAEIIEAGGYPYNSCFEGRIRGIANNERTGPNSGTHEDAAIYLLQNLSRQREMDRRVERLLAEGFEEIERVDGIEKFRRVVLYPHVAKMHGEWAEYDGARLVAEDGDRQAELTGRIAAVLPKGARTRGFRVNGRRVLVLR